MDVDTHGETGEVLERAARCPERLKGPPPKPISINLSRPPRLPLPVLSPWAT